MIDCFSHKSKQSPINHLQRNMKSTNQTLEVKSNADRPNHHIEVEYIGSKRLAIIQNKSDKCKKILRKVLSVLHENKIPVPYDNATGEEMMTEKTSKRNFIVSNDTDQTHANRVTVKAKKMKDNSESSIAQVLVKCPIDNGELC